MFGVRAVKVKAWYYNQCIKIGEAAAIYLREGDEATAEEYARKFMELSLQYALTLINMVGVFHLN